VSEIIMVDITKFVPNPYQPKTRVEVSPETAEHYGKSIVEHGMLQIPLARHAPFGKKGEHYEMGDGWLRLQGAKWAVEHKHPEFQAIDVEIRALTDEQMAQMVFEANGVRKDLDPIESAQFFKKYLEDFKVTEQQLADKLSISQGEIANTMRLLQLPEEIQTMVGTGAVPQTHARHLLRLNVAPEMQKKMVAEVVEGKVSVSDLSYKIDSNFWNNSKSLNPKADNYNKPLFDISVCQGCVSRVNTANPWGDKKKEDRCIKPDCWDKKQHEAEIELNKKAIEAAKKKGGEKILTSKTIQSNSYEFMDRDYSSKNFDQSACKDCEKTGLFKYRLDDDEKPQRICLDPACMRSKKSAFSRERNKADKLKDAELTKTLGDLFHQAHTRPTAVMVVAVRDALGHLSADGKRDVMHMFPNLSKLENGQMDVDGVKGSLGTKSLEDLTDMVAAIIFTNGRRNHNYGGNDFSTEIKGDLLYDYAQLQGTFKGYLLETTAWQEENCRGCNLCTEALIGTGLECCHQTYNKKIQKDGNCEHGKHVKKAAAAEKAPGGKDKVTELIKEIKVPCESCGNDDKTCHRENFHVDGAGLYICEHWVTSIRPAPSTKPELNPAVGKLTHGPQKTSGAGAPTENIQGLQEVVCDQKTLRKILDMNSCNSLTERPPKLKGLYELDGKKYACTGGLESGNEGVIEVDCYPVMLDSEYKGLKRTTDSLTGIGYSGIWGAYKGTQYVLIGSVVKFLPQPKDNSEKNVSKINQSIPHTDSHSEKPSELNSHSHNNIETEGKTVKSPPPAQEALAPAGSTKTSELSEPKRKGKGRKDAPTSAKI
jgi:ParB family chromosome partitioning protein